MFKVVLAALVSLCLLLPSKVGAAPLEGDFSIAGLGDVQVGPNFIDWGESGNIFGATNGDILFVSGTGSFNVLQGTTGTIEDLNQGTHPTGVPISESNFLTADARPTWNFTLEFIQPGGGTVAGCTAAPGAVCTPFVGSPFTIVNLPGGGSSVALAVRGTVTDGSSDPASDFVGTFTTQFANLNAAEILSTLQTQGFVQSSHSAEFNATVIPEPASMLLLGTGLAAASFFRKKKKKTTPNA